MKIMPFLQNGIDLATILKISQLVDMIQPEEILFCFAYGTLSGYAEFQRRFDEKFWERTKTRWLFGIDYGRTDPYVLKHIAGKKNSEVKIFDGVRVSKADSFVPRQDFHPKMCFVLGKDRINVGMLSGSGNFSRNGLTRNIEGGVNLISSSNSEFNSVIGGTLGRVERLWQDADTLEDTLEQYEKRWHPGVTLGVTSTHEEIDLSVANYDRYWIDVGYVTRNRGPVRPGNQIDMPRGVHRFFKLVSPEPPRKNTRIGEVVFLHRRQRYPRNLRLGNNFMEKITLPFPETIGLGAYDGKILEFQRVVDGFRIRAFEQDDYAKIVRSTSSRVMRMGSGRFYGFR